MDRLTYRDRHRLSGQTSIMEPNAHLNLILLGTVQAGKSASGNTILGRQAFVTKESYCSVKQDVAVESGTVFGFPVTVYDTPGLINENQILLQYQSILQRCESGPCVFLLVINAERVTEETRRTVEKIDKLLGPNRFNKTWILFTRGDELDKENTTIKEFVARNEALKTLDKYNKRYHVFNNKKRGESDQARVLLAKIIQTSLVLNASEGGMLPRQITMVTLDLDVISRSSTRIILLGKTGFGKSASGNTILGQNMFKSETDSNSVTHVCSVKHATISGRFVSVVDTPGFFDTRDEVNTDEQLKKEIARSVYLSSPGPHAFLIVLRAIDRFTEQEQQIPQMIEIMFGEEVLKYSILLFTHGDQLKGKSMENLIKGNSRLRHLVQECGGRFHIFNNEDQNNREQVNDLLQKIDTMIEQNGGGHYSNQMFQDAQRYRREEEKRKQREGEQRKQQEEETERIRIQMQEMRTEYEAQRSKLERQREEEWRKQQKEIERVRIQMQNMRTEYAAQRFREEREKMLHRTQSGPEFEEFYREYERRFSFSAFIIGRMKLTGIGAVCGGLLGATVGAIAGPAGVAAGAALGAAFGGTLGTAFHRHFNE